MDHEEHISNPDVTVQPKEDRVFNFWSGVSVALSLIAAQFIVAILAAIIAGVAIGFDSESYMDMVMGITLILAFPVAVWIVFRKRKLEVSAWEWNNKFWVLLPISFIMVFSMSYLIGVLLEMLPNYDQMLEQYSEMFEGMNQTMLIIGGGLVGPICEEIIFRGIILKGLLKTYDYKKAILFSSVIFGVIHLVPIQVISAFFIGIILGYLYYKTRSLWLVSIIHVANNVIAFVSNGELISDETTRAWFDNDVLFVGSLILATLLIYGSYILFERINGPRIVNETENIA